MRRDKVIGLALATIVIGFAAAFCFRNEHRDPFQGPRLKNPQALDDAIANQRGPKPYREKAEPTESGVQLQGVEVGNHADVPTAGGADHRRQPPVSPFETSPRPARRPQTDYTRSVPAPDPIPIRSEPASQPAHNRPWVPVPSESEAQTSRRLPEAEQPPRMHRVRAGDTLSELASRYLGSSVRFMEIFEANRHVLKSPDDLPAGMTIRIPERRALRRASRPRPGGAVQPMSPTSGGTNRVGFDDAAGDQSAAVDRQSDAGGDAGTSAVPPRSGAEPRIPASHGRFVPVRHSPFRGNTLRLSIDAAATEQESPPSAYPVDVSHRFDYQFFPRGS